jgi:C4-dicarboxylate-specific signal transduction histidine kinase
VEAALHSAERERILALRSYGILDTPREAEFDDIVRVVSAICETPISAINLIDQDRQWFKAEVGLGIREAPLPASICAHAILQPGLLIVPDMLNDRRFSDNPLVVGEPHLRFYAGALLETDQGLPLGAICVLDYKPRQLNENQQDLLRLMASQIMKLFELRRKNAEEHAARQTDRKRAEEAVRDGEERYRQVRTELAHANRLAAMGQLSASIAHEINQPIGAAITYANAALSWLRAQPPNWEEVQQALGFIVESGVRAGEVIDRIRTLVRKAPPQKDKVDINEAILEVLALIRAEIAMNAVSAKTQLAEGLPSVWGDRVQLQQVMLNLFINAIEAMSGMDDGSRQLLISTEKTCSDAVLVAVRDSGPGFPPESAERLFESFYTTKPGGLGMGLSICHSIIEAHEGRLWATAAEPRGAVFAFTLPVRPGNPLMT